MAGTEETVEVSADVEDGDHIDAGSLFVKRDIDELMTYLNSEEKVAGDEIDAIVYQEENPVYSLCGSRSCTGTALPQFKGICREDRDVHPPFLQSLTQFANDLSPTIETMKAASRAIIILERKLRKYFTQIKLIDRIVLLGSFGKRTGLRFKVDLDIVYYLDEAEPPYDAIVTELHQILTDHIDPKCRRSGRVLKFKIAGLFDVDFLPAKNMLPSGSSCPDARTQHANTLKLLQSSKDPFTLNTVHGTSLSEAAVEFQRSRSDFTRCMARLAKFWNKSIYLEGFHVGRSSVMEYLGVRASEEVDETDQNILSSFRRFLQLLRDAQDMSIYWTEFYTEENIPDEIKRQRPLLLDPTNPYNNMLSGENRSHIINMGRFAEVTLRRLDDVASNWPTTDIAFLFHPQPEFACFKWSRNIPTRCLVKISKGHMLLPSQVNERSVDINDLDALEDILLTITDAVSFSLRFHEPSETLERTKVAIETFCWEEDNTFLSKLYDLFVDSTRQTVFQFPMPRVRGIFLKAGFDWK